jgi:hypothetical protein
MTAGIDAAVSLGRCRGPVQHPEAELDGGRQQ